jgi:hypothetical protein
MKHDLNFFRGLIWAGVLSAPFWVAVIWLSQAR